MRKIEEPTVSYETHAGNETVETERHPAFAQIKASRVSGQANLYDSDFTHHSYMTVTIVRSHKMRSLHRDWHYGRQELISVAMTEAQWATFVSAASIGSGTPCTIEELDGEIIPGLPPPKSRHDQFDREIKAKLEKTVAGVRDAIKRIEAMGLSKSKTAEATDALRSVLTELNSNLPFVAKSFTEHMEDTTEKAKAEIHGYMTGIVQRAGLDALAVGALPLAIEHKPKS